MRGKFFSVARKAAATQRSPILPSRQRLTRLVLKRTPAWGLSMILVVPRQRRRAGDNSRRLMVKVSSRLSRRLAAAPG